MPDDQQTIENVLEDPDASNMERYLAQRLQDALRTIRDRDLVIARLTGS